MARKRLADIKKRWANQVKGLSAIEWFEAVKDSLRFSVFPKRFLPFFFSGLGIILVTFAFAGANDVLTGLLAYTEGTFPMELLYLLAWGVAAFIVLTIVDLWITGALVHQSRKPREFRESWGIACKRLPSLILALLIVSAITILVSLVPYIGILLSLLVAMTFLFVNQFIILDAKGFYKALLGSAKTFRGRLLSVFVAWLLGGLVSFMLIAVFTLPLLAAFYLNPQYIGEDLLVILAYSDETWLYCGMVLLLAGTAISKVFGLKFLTEIYMQLRKKKWLLL